MQTVGEICCRFASSWGLHSVSGPFLLPLTVSEAAAIPSLEIWVLLGAAGALVCCGAFGSLFLCFNSSLANLNPLSGLGSLAGATQKTEYQLFVSWCE